SQLGWHLENRRERRPEQQGRGEHGNQLQGFHTNPPFATPAFLENSKASVVPRSPNEDARRRSVSRSRDQRGAGRGGLGQCRAGATVLSEVPVAELTQAANDRSAAGRLEHCAVLIFSICA